MPPDDTDNLYLETDRFATDQALLAGLVACAPGAVETFVARFLPPVRRMIVSRFRLDDADVDDLLQQFFIHLSEDDWRRLRQWNQQASLKTYISAIANNLVLDELRKRRSIAPVDEFVELPEDGNDGESWDDLDREDLDECIRDAMDHLRIRDRQIIRRRHWQGASYQEIAAAEGMTVNNVGVALMRAEKRLAALIERICGELLALIGRVSEVN